MDQQLVWQNRYRALGNLGVRLSSYLVLLAILNSAQRLWGSHLKNKFDILFREKVYLSCVRALNLDVGDAKRILSKYYGKTTLV